MDPEPLSVCVEIGRNAKRLLDIITDHTNSYFAAVEAVECSSALLKEAGSKAAFFWITPERSMIDGFGVPAHVWRIALVLTDGSLSATSRGSTGLKLRDRRFSRRSPDSRASSLVISSERAAMTKWEDIVQRTRIQSSKTIGLRHCSPNGC